MTVFYGERGLPVATIENDRLFLASGEPHGFLKDGFIFSIQDNFVANGMGYKYNPGDCFSSLVNGVIYNNDGKALAFCIDCQDGSPTPGPTGRETIPEDITKGRDIRELPFAERPAFFLEKLAPIARHF